MTVTFSTYTLYGVLLGVLLPLVYNLQIWIRYWVEILWDLHGPKQGASKEKKRDSMSPGAIVVLFEAQYYPSVLLQPLHWALPWMLMLGTLGLIVGVFLDNVL